MSNDSNIFRCELKIDGMTCSACSGTIESMLNDEETVIKAEISLLMSKGIVTYKRDSEGGMKNGEELVEMIEMIGFEGQVLMDEKVESDGPMTSNNGPVTNGEAGHDLNVINNENSQIQENFDGYNNSSESLRSPKASTQIVVGNSPPSSSSPNKLICGSMSPAYQTPPKSTTATGTENETSEIHLWNFPQDFNNEELRKVFESSEVLRVTQVKISEKAYRRGFRALSKEMEQYKNQQSNNNGSNSVMSNLFKSKTVSTPTSDPVRQNSWEKLKILAKDNVVKPVTAASAAAKNRRNLDNPNYKYTRSLGSQTAVGIPESPTDDPNRIKAGNDQKNLNNDDQQTVVPQLLLQSPEPSSTARASESGVKNVNQARLSHITLNSIINDDILAIETALSPQDDDDIQRITGRETNQQQQASGPSDSQSQQIQQLYQTSMAATRVRDRKDYQNLVCVTYRPNKIGGREILNRCQTKISSNIFHDSIVVDSIRTATGTFGDKSQMELEDLRKNFLLSIGPCKFDNKFCSWLGN